MKEIIMEVIALQKKGAKIFLTDEGWGILMRIIEEMDKNDETLTENEAV